MTAPPSDIRRATVPADRAGERLDRYLVALAPDLSRARVQALIAEGYATVDGRAIGEAGRKVKPGEAVALTVPPPVAAEPAPEDIPLSVVYEDPHLIVIDKPAGLVVHPAAGHGSGTLVNALIAHCGEELSGIGGVRRPGIVHRLDKDTSGLLVVAKSDAAHRGLAAQFAAHGRDGRLEREYQAVAWGVPDRTRGTIDRPLGRKSSNRTKVAVVEEGREAVTHYAVEEVFGTRERPGLASLLAVTLETGRTHQIRVHLASIGHPLLGDAAYGAGFKSSERLLPERVRSALAALGRQALHAGRLGFVHPVTGDRLDFTSPLPPALEALVDALRARNG